MNSSICALGLAVAALATGAIAQSYSVSDLGTLGGPTSAALAVNDVGQVAGFATFSNGNQRAFVWSKTTGMKSLPLVHAGDGTALANGINNSGQIVGTSGAYAFLWTKIGGIEDLGNLGGSAASAYGVNNSGAVVGESFTSDDAAEHAFFWTQAGGMQDLGTLGGSFSIAYAINDSDEVVGYSLLSDNVTPHAFSWTQAGGMEDLGTLGGSNSAAYGINSSGEIVGTTTSETSLVAFTWTQANGMRAMNLGNTVALGVNSSGEAVGYWTPSSVQVGIVWTPAKGVQNLNSLTTSGPRVQVANAINKTGQIAASGTNFHALLLTLSK